MPSPTRTLTPGEARSLIDGVSFPESSARRVGIEIEWFTTPSSSPPDVATLRRLLAPGLPLPCGSAITFEPGGQVELSSIPFDSCDEACSALATDRDAIETTLREYGIGLVAGGVDPDRAEKLATDEPRYVAMKSYFDQRGPSGRRMMCTTAAVHTNIDAGRDDLGRYRWRLAHQLGPTLVAAFADSPIVAGKPSGWMSSRMAAWLAIDPTRTAPVPNGADPVDAWAAYALGANVMFIRTPERFVPMTAALPFARWIDEGHELGFPTADDLTYHLTTLFPPVRPHGRLELRMMDMVPDPYWRVAASVSTALLYDEEAAERADAATQVSARLWHDAARSALGHPALWVSARTCFDAALQAVDRMGCDRETIDAVAEYTDRYVRAGRSPADDRLRELKQPATQIAEAL